MVKGEDDDAALILDVVRQIVDDANPRIRAVGADAVTDLRLQRGRMETTAVGHVLALAYELESDGVAMEAQLNSLADLADSGLLSSGLLLHILGIDRPNMAGSGREHLEYLAQAIEMAK